MQKLSHNYVAYFDNVSHIRDWISDELCKAVTGSGFSKRQLYTDDDDIIYNFKRCLGFNGINLAATRADLLDRGLVIELAPIAKDKRCKINEIWAKFYEMRPQVLGYLLDTLVKALKSLRDQPIDLKEHPRMADWAEISEAISRAIGNRPEAFLDAYYKNIGIQTQEAIAANPIAVCISGFMADRSVWEGTYGSLLQELEKVADEQNINTSKMEIWPRSPSILSRRITEATTNLREVGIKVERLNDKRTNTRYVVICRDAPAHPEPPRVQELVGTISSALEGKIGDVDNTMEATPSAPPEITIANDVRVSTGGGTGRTGDTISVCTCPYCSLTCVTADEVITHSIRVHPGKPVTADLSRGAQIRP